MNSVAKARLPFARLMVLAVAGSLTLAPMAVAKHAAFEMPTCDRLMDGDGPNANKPAEANTESGSTAASKPASRDLSPMKLTNDKDSFSVGTDGKVKMTVQENVTREEQTATAPGETMDKPESVIKSKDDALSKKLLKEAKAVNLGPTPLLESEDETQKKMDTIGDAERMQLTDLWSATINRSPDIQFVINRLQPNSDPSHATGTALKMLSGALFSAVQAVPMMMGPGMNSMLMYSGVGSGSQMLQGLIGANDAKNGKKQQISQEQATILYKIVRDTADKVVIEYRKYKKSRSDYERSVADLEDLRGMVAQARMGQDSAKQIEMEYTVRKAQRDVENVNDEARMHRQALADLAGPDAVVKLDSEMEQETLALQKLTGGEGLKNDDLQAKPDQIAGTRQNSPELEPGQTQDHGAQIATPPGSGTH